MYQQANLDKSNYFNQKIKDGNIISPNYPTVQRFMRDIIQKKIFKRLLVIQMLDK
ncbi:hypothetical protein M973_06495 [Francisella orientalis LADL 07-285A]|nr:hypothetical protein M973_06495 [Francisella orientalis LADL 07-285A]